MIKVPVSVNDKVETQKAWYCVLYQRPAVSGPEPGKQVFSLTFKKKSIALKFPIIINVCIRVCERYSCMLIYIRVEMPPLHVEITGQSFEVGALLIPLPGF